MSRISAVLFGIIALFLLIGPFRSPISDGIKGWRTSSTTENYNVTTAAAVTAANVTLSYDLYQAATAEVIGITSNVTETPVANTYTEATKVLLVSGLDADATHTLAVTYYAETDDEVMQVLGPFLSFIIFGLPAFAIIYGIWPRHRRG
jgi:post-segregation antitoxin (ccd killing protein)